MTPEAEVLSDCLSYLKRLKANGEPIHWFKVAGGPRQQVGQPDLLICYRGRFVACEIKAPGKAPTPLQLHRLGQWEKAGAVAGYATSVGELAKLLSGTTVAS